MSDVLTEIRAYLAPLRPRRRCWGFHLWTKWSRLQMMMLGGVKVAEYVGHRQERTCERCGKIQRRDFGARP